MFPTTNQFHEDTFDGVVIKIPKWMIDLNGDVLKKALNDLKLSLEASTGNSMEKMISLNELSNYENKKDRIQTEKDTREKAKQLAIQKDLDLANHVIIPCTWKDKQGVVNSLRIPLKNGEELTFDIEEVLTKKGNESAEFRKKFDKLIPDINLYQFAWDNNMSELSQLLKKNDDTKNCYFSFNGFTVQYGWQLAIKYKILFAKVYSKRNSKLYYIESPIGYETGSGRDPNKFTTIYANSINLDDYEFKNLTFTKKAK